MKIDYTRSCMRFGFSRALMAVYVLTVGILLTACAGKPKPADGLPYTWAVEDVRREFVYWHHSTQLQQPHTDTIPDAMTIETHDYMLTTTTRLNDARLIKSELIRRTERGVMRLLACDDNTIAEQLFIPFPASLGTTWLFKTCTGDTVSTFRILTADTTVRVPAGEFRVFVMREVDHTPLTTDMYISERTGIVKINYSYSLYDSTKHHYTDDPRAKPFEGFVLTSVANASANASANSPKR
jgi:hypothetical protein